MLVEMVDLSRQTNGISRTFEGSLFLRHLFKEQIYIMSYPAREFHHHQPRGALIAVINGKKRPGLLKSVTASTENQVAP